MSKWAKLKEAMGEAWGLSSLAVGRSLPSEHALEVYLPVGDSERVLVGTLRRERSEVVFRYAPEFRRRGELPAIADFPEKDREYRSQTLWPFFEQRLPPIKRADVVRKLKSKSLSAQADRFVLLAELGRTTLTSPYELEAKHAS